MDNLKKLALAQQDYVVGIRRELHRNPGTRFNTDFTREFILNEISTFLKSDNSNIKIGVPRESKGGIIIDVDIPGCKDRFLFRADFDALSVREETGLEYASVNEGISHACGHDAHTAMLLGFFKAISKGCFNPVHNLRLVFQDGEENPGIPPEKESGGEILVREGVLDDINSAYTLHILMNNDARNGYFMSRSGAMMANSGRIIFRIKSAGGHAGMPAAGKNSLRIAQAIMNRLDLFMSNQKASSRLITMEPVILNSGKSSNVMPADAELWYSFRTLLPRDEHIEMTKKVMDEAKEETSGAGAELEAIPIYGAPLLLNNPDIYEHVKEILNNNGQKTAEIPPMFGGEDFAYYLNNVPGVMFWLNAYREGSGAQHSPTFNPDEDVFWRGVHYWILLATAPSYNLIKEG